MANISFYMDIQVFLLTHLLTQILCSGFHKSVRPPSKAISPPYFQTHPYTKKAPAENCKCLDFSEF